MKYRLPLVTTIATFILILLGVFVVGLDAGLACSDWPLCNGRILPPLQGIILVEFTHRTFSSLTGILIIWNAVSLWRKFRNDRLTRFLSILSVVLLGLVGVLGGVNVLKKLPSGLTAIDMAVAMLLLAVLVTLTVREKSLSNRAQDLSFADGHDYKSLQVLYKPAMFAAGAVYFEILIGGFFKHSSASHTYVHPESPLSNELVTRFPVAEAVMYVHMFAAFLVLLSIFWLFVYARKQKSFYKQAISMLVLTGVQGFLGFLTLMTKLELLTTTAHMAVASMLLMISVNIAMSVKFAKMSVTDGKADRRKPGVRTVISNG